MTFRETRALIDADICRVAKFQAAFSGAHVGLVRKISILLAPPMMAVAIYRLAHYFYANGWIGLARLVGYINYVLHKVEISPGARIGPGLYIPHPLGCRVHAHCGSRVTIYGHAMVCSHVPFLSKLHVTADCPTLEDDVVIAAHTAVVGSMTIGAGSTVGLGLGWTEPVPAGVVILPALSTIVRPDESSEVVGMGVGAASRS